MKVVNVAGFDVSFEKDGIVYKVPSDNQLHLIPDNCYYEDNFQGLLRVIVPPLSVKQMVKKMSNGNRMIDINDSNVREIVIGKIEEKKSKPLAGKKIKASTRARLRKTNKKKEE